MLSVRLCACVCAHTRAQYVYYSAAPRCLCKQRAVLCYNTWPRNRKPSRLPWRENYVYCVPEVAVVVNNYGRN